MPFDPIFLLALQSSLVLGVIHGINPCGHSWLVIAPFVVGRGSGRRAFALTASFLAGTALACLLIGLTLGAISMSLPPGTTRIVGLITGGIVIVLGLILIIKPSLLHSHEHDHDHDEEHHHDDHAHCHHHDHDHRAKASMAGLFSIGFVNMIVPCPTVAIMYSYAIDSGSWQKSTAVFGVYALTTALVVGGVIFLLRRAANALRKLDNPHLEGVAMRLAGLLTMGFGLFSLYSEFA